MNEAEKEGMEEKTEDLHFTSRRISRVDRGLVMKVEFGHNR